MEIEGWNIISDALQKISLYIPKNERLKLFNSLYQEYNCNSRLLSKVSQIQLRRIYFYLPDKKNIVRSYPNDQTTYLLLKAYFKKNPKKALLFLMNICHDINKLKTELFIRKIQPDIAKLYDIMM